MGMMSRLSLQLRTPIEMQRLLADRVRAARVGLGLKQATLADRAGVTLASLRRFEQRGETSLKHLMRICEALNRLDEFELLLRPPAAQSLAELESRVERPARRRGNR